MCALVHFARNYWYPLPAHHIKTAALGYTTITLATYNHNPRVNNHNTRVYNHNHSHSHIHTVHRETHTFIDEKTVKLEVFVDYTQVMACLHGEQERADVAEDHVTLWVYALLRVCRGGVVSV